MTRGLWADSGRVRPVKGEQASIVSLFAQATTRGMQKGMTDRFPVERDGGRVWVDLLRKDGRMDQGRRLVVVHPGVDEFLFRALLCPARSKTIRSIA